jgi:amino acid adenylation domain-containing protein
MIKPKSRTSSIVASQNIKEKKYWLNKLSGDLAKASFPYDLLNPKNELNARSLEFELKGECYERLMKVSNNSHMRSMMILNAALVTLLSRYNQQDIILAVPITRQEAKGKYINTVLPLRFSLTPGHTFKELLLITRQTFAEAIENQNYPIDALCYQLNIPVSGKDYPLFDIALVHEEVHDRGYIDHINFNLIFNFAQIENGLKCTLEYNSSNYRRSSIERIVGYYKTVIEKCLSELDIKISRVEILSEKEIDLLKRVNATDNELFKNKTIKGIFENLAKDKPESTAIIFKDQKLTYDTLNKKANQLAHLLKANHALKPQELVGILMQRSEKMIIAILAVLKAGGAYVPIDPNYPSQRINHMLEDSQCKVFITDAEITSSEVNGNIQCLKFNNLRILSTYSNENPGNEVQADQLAYVIYTSGSTGKPKGVLIENKGIVNTALDQIENFNIKESDHVLQFASIAFDASIYEISMALLSGAALVLIENETIKDAILFSQYLQDKEVSVVVLPPSYLHSLNQDPLPTVHTIITAGEAPNIADIKFYNGFKNYINAYGPTETSVCACFFKITNALDLGEVIPFGKPISNTKVYILDAHHNRVPIGAKGELYISGLGLARGYLNSPHLNDIAFINNPFEQDAVMYKTGDFARWLTDGDIEFIGRNDDQVKIRGFRVELGEIQSILLKHPSVKQAFVSTMKHETDNDHVILAHIVGSKGFEIDLVRDYMKSQAPHYMVPDFFFVLNELPVTSNGKVNKNALPKPSSDLSLSVQFAAPVNVLEEKLSDIWKKVLGKDQIGIFENFFQLGGHSLKATQVVSRIFKELNIKIELRDLLLNPTIADLAGVIQSGERIQQTEISPAPVQEFYDLSHAQKRLWMIEQIEKNQVAYNISCAYLLENVDKGLFENAFSTVIERHESLRTAFVLVEDEPKQKIHKYQDIVFGMEHVDLRTAPDKDTQITLFSKRESEFKFNLENAPLVKGVLIQIEENKFVFLLTMHHIIMDGWSLNILAKEIHLLYKAFHSGEANPLLPAQIHYKDFAYWQNSFLKTTVDEQYWLGKLGDGVQIINLSYDFEKKEVNRFQGRKETFFITETDSKALNAIAKKNATTLSTIVFTAFNIMLSRLTGQKEIAVGMSIANRNNFYLENLIGFFANILIIKTSLEEDMELNDLIDSVKSNINEAFEHQNYPFDLLVEKLNPKRNGNYQSLINVVYTFINVMDVNIEINMKQQPEGVGGDELFTIKPLEDLLPTTSKFDLLLFVHEVDNSIKLTLEYSSDLFKNETILQYGKYLNSIIRAITTEFTTTNKGVLAV